MHRARLFAILVLAALVAPALTASPARAQTPPPGVPAPPRLPPGLRDPQSGDHVWAFANEFPFFDERAAIALAATMTTAIDTGPVLPVLPADANLRRPVPSGQATLLMEAAGLRGRPGSPNPPLPLKVLGPCKVWLASDPAGISGNNAGLQKSAEVVGAAFVQALRDLLGVTVPPCTTTTNVAEAQILFWIQDSPAPANPMRQTSTLLAPASSLPSPAGVTPARGGNAGLKSEGAPRGLVIAMLFVVAATAATARALDRRSR